MQIEMRGIDKSFGGNAVLKNAGFLLDHGEIHALMGENGAGKSTLAKLLCGFEKQNKGIIRLKGKDNRLPSFTGTESKKFSRLL